MIDPFFLITFRVLDSTSDGILAVIFPSIIVKSGKMEHNGSADGIGIQSLSDERTFTPHRMQDRRQQQTFRATIAMSFQLCLHMLLNGSKPSGVNTKNAPAPTEHVTTLQTYSRFLH